jgi:hypothetical protein
VNRVAALLITAVLALGAAGCGGGGGDGRLSKSQYERQLETIGRELQPTLSALLSFNPTDLARAPQFMTTLADALDRVAHSLGSVEPPKDVAALNAQIVGGAASTARQLRALAATLRAAPPKRVSILLARFDPRRLTGLRSLALAANALASKGYRFSPGGGK